MVVQLRVGVWVSGCRGEALMWREGSKILGTGKANGR